MSKINVLFGTLCRELRGPSEYLVAVKYVACHQPGKVLCYTWQGPECSKTPTSRDSDAGTLILLLQLLVWCSVAFLGSTLLRLALRSLAIFLSIALLGFKTALLYLVQLCLADNDVVLFSIER